MSHNTELVGLLSHTEWEYDERESRSIERVGTFLSQLDDKVLVAVTRQAVANCAFRLAMNPDTDVVPTEELLKHSLIHTLDLLKKSVREEYG